MFVDKLLNKPELTCSHIAEWFQVLIGKTDNSI